MPADAALLRMADFFGCDVEELLAAKLETLSYKKKGQKSLGKTVMGSKTDWIPLIGTIACGTPILAYENVEELIPVPPRGHPEFALHCRGESMKNAGIHDGDIVYIKLTPTVDNGRIAAVLIGDEATLKKVYFYPDHITLVPANETMEPITYFGDEMEGVSIIGEAVGVYARL